MSTKSKVVCFKNIVGQEIVTKMFETLENGDIVVQRPYTLNVAGFTPDGQAELQMMPLFLMNPACDITLKSSFLGSLPIDAPLNLEKEYLEQSSSLVLKLN